MFSYAWQWLMFSPSRKNVACFAALHAATGECFLAGLVPVACFTHAWYRLNAFSRAWYRLHAFSRASGPVV